jgi:hypothetical protein
MTRQAAAQSSLGPARGRASGGVRWQACCHAARRGRGKTLPARQRALRRRPRPHSAAPRAPPAAAAPDTPPSPARWSQRVRSGRRTHAALEVQGARRGAGKRAPQPQPSARAALRALGPTALAPSRRARARCRGRPRARAPGARQTQQKPQQSLPNHPPPPTRRPAASPICPRPRGARGPARAPVRWQHPHQAIAPTTGPPHKSPAGVMWRARGRPGAAAHAPPDPAWPWPGRVPYLFIPFSAFWLRSSVVSVLISLITDMLVID